MNLPDTCADKCVCVHVYISRTREYNSQILFALSLICFRSYFLDNVVYAYEICLTFSPLCLLNYISKSSREIRAVSEYLSKAIRTISLQQFWNCQVFVLVTILRNSHTVRIEGLVSGIFTFYSVVIQDNFRGKKRCTILSVQSRNSIQ